jgi:hypothetical protein
MKRGVAGLVEHILSGLTEAPQRSSIGKNDAQVFVDDNDNVLEAINEGLQVTDHRSALLAASSGKELQSR